MGYGADCSADLRPGHGVQLRRPGSGLFGRSGPGRRGGPFLRPPPLLPPGEEEPHPGGSAGRPLLVRRHDRHAGVYGDGDGRGDPALCGLRPSGGWDGLFSPPQPLDTQGRVGHRLDFGKNWVFYPPPLPFCGGSGKKIFKNFKKSLSFLWHVVYNNKETWRGKEKAQGRHRRERRPRMV